jgi:hypothetical protein
MRAFFGVTLLVLAGCAAPEYERPDWGGAVWDTTYLIDADPAGVDLDVVAASLESHYWDFAQHEGVCIEPQRSDVSLADPDKFDTGGDSGIYTGTALAAWSFKYGVTKAAADLAHVHHTLRAVWMLTHAPGPGVLCRVTFPVGDEALFDFPARWESRKPFVGKSAADLEDAVLGGVLPEMRFYTRATKDQLTGLLLGLSAAWKIVGPSDPLVRGVVRRCARDIYDHLVKHDWNIRDAKGENDTNADHVDGLMRTQLYALLAATDVPEFRDVYVDEFVVSDLGDLYLFSIFNNYSQYYAWNLRYSRALSVWLLEDDADRREQLADFVGDSLWANTSGHMNGWFAAIQAGMNGDAGAKTVLVDSLKSLGLKPIRNYSSPYVGQQYGPNVFEVFFGLEDKYVLPPHLRKPTGYTTWQKRPWDVQDSTEPDKEPHQNAVGLDFLLAYWCGRYFGAL